MPKNLTHIYCFDDHRTFTEEIRKKFDDPSRYIIHPFQTHDEIMSWLESEKENRSCKIAIIGVNDPREQGEMIERLTSKLLKNDPQTGIILLYPPEKMEEIKKNMKFNIDAYIPQNANFILRIHNTVKKRFSEHNIMIHRKRRNMSLLAVLAFLLASGILIIVSKFRFPGFF